jgi:nucleotide-binding universal stress UspA family protein
VFPIVQLKEPAKKEVLAWSAAKSFRREASRADTGTPGGRAALGGRRVIMLATSGSSSAVDATVLAAELAAEFNATLRIVHVETAIEYKVGRLAPMRAIERKLADPFESPVLRDARELAWHHGAAATLQLVRGEPSRAIVTATADHHADLLIIGAPRRNRGLLRKSATRRWIQAHAPCQVLTPSARRELTI